MADLPFKINIETESGKKVSYFTQSLALTTETSVSSSVILARINLLESSSYSDDAIISETGRSGSIQAGVTGHQYYATNGATQVAVYPQPYNPTGSGMPATDGRFTFIDSAGDRQVLGYTDLIWSFGYWKFNNVTGWRGSGNQVYAGSYNGWGGPNFSDSENLWLSASLDGTHYESGSITFRHTDVEDTVDRLKRYRFFGTKVCNVLGLPEGHWLQPSNFSLDDTGTGRNYFSGDISARTLAVSNNVSFSPLSSVTSNLRWNIDKNSDVFLQFTSGSAATQENLLLMGWDTDANKMVLNTPTTDVKFEIGETNNGSNIIINASHFKSNNWNSPSYHREHIGSYFRMTGSGVSAAPFDGNTLPLNYNGQPCFYVGSGLTYGHQITGSYKQDDGNDSAVIYPVAFGRNFQNSPSDSPVVSGSVFSHGIPFNEAFDVYDSEAGSNPNHKIHKTLHLHGTYEYGTEEFRVHMGMVVSRSAAANGESDAPLIVGGYNSSNVSIYAERDVAAYSDVRQKTDIETIKGSLNTLDSIRGVTFTGIDHHGSGSGPRRMGVIAQELEPYLPEIVSTDGDGYKSVKYGNLTALLIQGIKDQQEQIEELKQQVKEIKDANHG